MPPQLVALIMRMANVARALSNSDAEDHTESCCCKGLLAAIDCVVLIAPGIAFCKGRLTTLRVSEGDCISASTHLNVHSL